MLSLHRRHLSACDHRLKGWNYTLCDCPIWCDGTLDGRRITKSLQTRNWERALSRIASLSRGVDIGLETQPKSTVERAVKTFLKSRANLRPSSQRSYTATLEAFAAALGARQLDRVEPFDIESYLSGRKAKGKPLAPRTARKELRYLRTMFTWCKDKQWISENPAKRVRLAKVDDAATLPYTEDEIQRLLSACDRMQGLRGQDLGYIRQRAKALLLVLLYSGLRISDVATLRRGALESSGHLVLRRTQKTGVPIKVLLHPDARRALERLPGPNPEYVFWAGKSDPEHYAKSLWKTVSRVGKLAGIHAHPHRFRDTFAVELLTQGADIRTVQKLLGHESVRTTEKHYAHFVAAHQVLLDTAVAKLDFRKPARPVVMGPRNNRLRNAK